MSDSANPKRTEGRFPRPLRRRRRINTGRGGHRAPSTNDNKLENALAFGATARTTGAAAPRRRRRQNVVLLGDVACDADDQELERSGAGVLERLGLADAERDRIAGALMGAVSPPTVALPSPFIT